MDRSGADSPLLLHISSEYRPNASQSPCDFTVPFHIQTQKQYKSMILRDLVIPQTWFNIVSGKNVFYFQDAGGNKQFTLIPGNYDLDTLKAQILALSTTAGRALTVTDSFNFRLTFTATANVIIKWSQMPELARICGFYEINTANATSHTGSKCYDLSPDRFLYLTIEGLHSCYTPGRSNSFTMPIALYSNGGVISKQETQLSVSIDDNFLRNSSLRITLTHSDGRVCDLNGLDWGFTVNLV